jgi:hypothetical protein
MRRSIVALGALITIAGVFQAAAPAKAAIDYPFCRTGPGDGGYSRRCDYSTLEQCLVTNSGVGGSCGANPFYNARANATYGGSTRRVR